jgi:hypothetical protein
MTRHSLSAVVRWCGVALALGASVLIPAGSAVGAQVGPGTNIPNDTWDTVGTGGRINVDQGNPLNLPAGTYLITTFSYDAGTTGDVTPFLAVSANASDPTNLYTAIAVGNTVNVVAAPLTDQTVPFGGSATFTLNTPRVVYAGITSSLQNPVFLDLDTPAQNTDHEGTMAPSYDVTVGGQVPPDGAFSNVNLTRSYAFSINVEVIPEPSAGLLVLAGSALCGLRRRRR